MRDNQSPGRIEIIAFVKSVQNISTEWRRFSDQENRQYKEKALLKLRLERRQRRRQIHESKQKRTSGEKSSQKKAHETFFYRKKSVMIEGKNFDSVSKMIKCKVFVYIKKCLRRSVQP